ncbi:MAG: NifU N-terminal domain-containing protein [bacterium]|nr:NifU N-terminal domain-containing protein [bacterium]
MSDPLNLMVLPTPNTNALKFVVGRRLTHGRSQTFRSAEEAVGNPLAAGLFAIPGVVQVFVLNDFVTVTRDPAAAWESIAGRAEITIREYLAGS